MYTFYDAARLAQVAPGTVRNWLFGHEAQDRSRPPLFQADREQGAMVSFLQLVEIVVAARFRKAERKSFAMVRQTYETARRMYDIDYPFAHLRLEVIGGHIVHELRRGVPYRDLQHSDEVPVTLQALDVPKQHTLPGLVQEIHDQLDWIEDLASRWYPMGKDIPTTVDPQMSAGMPTIYGSGITVKTLYRRWKHGGLPIDFIARDYQMPTEQVEVVCRYADRIAA